MATTYVYSLHGGATVAHIGDAHHTVCGFVPIRAYRVTDMPPPNRRLCAQCVKRSGQAAASAAARADDANARHAERRALILALLKDGLDNAAVARRLGMSLSTVVRDISAAMRRERAASRFAWGYTIGFRDGRA